MIFLFFISWLICLAYLSWISLLFVSWLKPKDTHIKNNDKPIGISIVIAIRNESANLPLLLTSISQLDYPHHLFEVIFIDDHSEDNSKEIINTFIKDYTQITIKYLALGEDNFGKKTALYEAYKQTNNNIIITTDGDVELPIEWLTNTAKAFQDPNILMVLGGVKINHSASFIGDFQALELLSLIASGAGAARLKHPIMSNGANISFRKKILNQLNKDALRPNIPSGDDMFLMLETKRKFGAESIIFLKDISHFIHTSPITSWKELINQRTRWVSKSA
ncbi:MAG: glycosyltransferase, partial [Bacteroidales bacterium]|nr:glycosyltransferase [Bacteroidales bacterium]